MAQDKDLKTPNVPPLRFPGFTDDWKQTTLNEVADFIKERVNTSCLQDNYVSTENLIGNFGGVQMTMSIPLDTNVIRFKKGDVLVSNIRPYLRKVWFADKEGGCSADVFVFRAKGIEPSFLYNTIANDSFINYVMSGAKGVKMPRGDKQQMLKYPFFVPSIEEQRKISSLLSLLNERIATQNKIIDNLQSLINGLIQCLSQEGLANGRWHKIMLSEILTERNELNEAYHPVHSVSVCAGVVNQVEYLGRSFAAKDTAHYHVAHNGDIVYTKSPTGNQPYGIVKQSHCLTPAAVSPLYGVYQPTSFEAGNYLHYYFLNSLNTNNYLSPLIQKGAKNTINISNQRFLENRIPFPIDEMEVKLVSDSLSALDKKIRLEYDVLTKLEHQKKFLLTNLFI